MRELNITPIRSVERAINILNAFSMEKPVLTIDEITRLTKLSKATAYRLLYTLERGNLINYNEETQKYSLGLKLLKHGDIITSSLDIVKESEDILSQIHNQIKQTVLMVVIDGDQMVYVFKREIQVGLKYSSSVGERRPLTYGVLGYTALAFLPKSQIDRLLSEPIPKITPYTVIEKDTILEKLKKIKNEGVYVETNETTIGVTGIGAPVFNARGEVIAAIGILYPSLQLEDRELEDAKNLLIHASKQISLKMGFKSEA